MAATYAQYPSLKDRTVVISGGAEGIGASIVEHFAAQGSKVIFLDISDNAAQTLVARLPERLTYYHCNLTDLDELRKTADSIVQKHSRIDVLINNAAQDKRMETAKVTPEFWDQQVAINLRHYFFLTQYLVPSMQEAKSGVIINIGSITWAIPSVGLPVYASLKAGVLGLTRTHAREYGKDGIRINSIMPGGIYTPRQVQEIITPEYDQWMKDSQALKISLMPEDVARLALFLAADDSRGIAGQSYVVDAGWT